MLLEHKPNVNALDKDGYTALAIACKEGFYDIALSLINSGAYINVQVRLCNNIINIWKVVNVIIYVRGCIKIRNAIETHM